MIRFISLFLIFSFASYAYASLRVGTVKYAPPFVMTADKKHIIGFDIDIMQSICKQMKTSCQFKTMKYTELFANLLNNTIDVAIADISITPSLQQKFLFSLPYLPSTAQFLTKRDDIQHWKDIKGKIVGIEHKALISPLINQFKNEITIKFYDEVSKMLADLNKGNLDVILLDTALAESWLANSGNQFHNVGESFPLGLGYGILAAKYNTKLIEQINKALLSIENNNTYSKIYDTYFGD